MTDSFSMSCALNISGEIEKVYKISKSKINSLVQLFKNQMEMYIVRRLSGSFLSQMLLDINSNSRLLCAFVTEKLEKKEKEFRDSPSPVLGFTKEGNN